MFRLRSQLIGHAGDVRSIASLPPGMKEGIISGSRDRTVRLWQVGEDGRSFKMKSTMAEHEGFVGCVAVSTSGMAVSGSDDATGRLFDLRSLDKDPRWLLGSEQAISACDISRNGEVVVTGSWDGTARIYRGGECSHVLKGHQGIIWCVLALGEDAKLVLTGGQDKAIRMWRDGREVKQFVGHTGVVRALANVPGVGFVSSGNDGTIRMWSLSGEDLHVLPGHEGEFCYCLATLPSGEIISGGEDRMVRVWRGTECVQTIPLPGSVWCVTVLPNGDIAAGTSDSIIRYVFFPRRSENSVFTREESRVASPEELAAFDKTIESCAVPKQVAGGGVLDVNKLPGPEALLADGLREGQQLFVKRGTNVEVHMWSAAEHAWKKIGDVLPGRPSNKAMLDGEEFDYVFNIELEGGRRFQLGYNAKDNPYETAQKFLWKNELDQDFLDQVAKFIIANTEGEQLGTSGGANDPFTGQHRYIPGTAAPPSGLMDGSPLTANRYRPSGCGGGGAPPRQSVAAPTSTVPKRGYLLFDNANTDGMLKKLMEYNGEVASQDSTVRLAYGDANMASLRRVLRMLSERTRWHAVSMDEEDYKILSKLLLWPPQFQFPAVDALRLTALHQQGNTLLAKDATLVDMLLASGGIGPVAEEEWEAPRANRLVCCRALANMWVHPGTRAVLLQRVEITLQMGVFAQPSDSNAKLVRLALGTFLLNASVALLEADADRDSRVPVGMVATTLLNDPEPEVALRGIVTLGTLACGGTVYQKAILELNVLEKIQAHAEGKTTASTTGAKGASVVNVAKDALRVLQQ